MAHLAMCVMEPSFEDRPASMEDRKKEGYF
jgi:hypothetical protein